MSGPQIKIIAVSNVFSKLMHFENAGDIEDGHLHNHDHATLISSGSVLFEILDDAKGNVVAAKTVNSPNFIFVHKNKYHRITALEPNTVCACIHAMRTIESDLLDPEFLIEPLDIKNNLLNTLIKNKTGETFECPAR